MTYKRQALVTGANKGLGLAIDKGLASAGLSVWMGARDRARGEDAVQTARAEGLDVRFVQIDVADDASVRCAAETVGREIDALDVLVNNAGIVLDLQTPPSELSMDDVKATYEVNCWMLPQRPAMMPSARPQWCPIRFGRAASGRPLAAV
jgi:NAD(P)-dependent dehydrogenase (short-subunit alcohol dehydrogenase family)